MSTHKAAWSSNNIIIPILPHKGVSDCLSLLCFYAKLCTLSPLYHLHERLCSRRCLPERMHLTVSLCLLCVQKSTLFLLSSACTGGSVAVMFQALAANGESFEDTFITACMVNLTRALEYVHRECDLSHNNVSLDALLYDGWGHFKLGSFIVRSLPSAPLLPAGLCYQPATPSHPLSAPPLLTLTFNSCLPAPLHTLQGSHHHPLPLPNPLPLL